MNYIIFFIVVFLVINLIYRVFVIRKDNALNKMKTSKDILLLCKVSGIKLKDYDLKSIVKKISMANSFIISLLATLTIFAESLIKNFYIWLLVSFIAGMVLLIPIIYVLYKFVGKMIKKEGEKNV